MIKWDWRCFVQALQHFMCEYCAIFLKHITLKLSSIIQLTVLNEIANIQLHQLCMLTTKLDPSGIVSVLSGYCHSVDWWR